MSCFTSEGDNIEPLNSTNILVSFRPNSKSQRNIPAAAGSAETSEAATSSQNGNVVNGDTAMNGVGESDVDEDMEIN